MKRTPHVERRLLVVHADDQAVVRDHRTEQNEQHRARSIIIRLHEGAQLSYFDLQQLSDVVCELTMLTVILDAYSRFTYEAVHTGARYAKTIINLQLWGEGAQATVRAGSITTGKQQHSFVTVQEHCTANAMSTCMVRSAVYDRALAHYDGSIVVAEGAHGTQAYQQQKSLLIGTEARSFSRPNLHSKTHDVHCTHGSASGPLDEEQLWYLQSRGMARNDAGRQLVRAFFADLYENDDCYRIMCSRVHGIVRLE